MSNSRRFAGSCCTLTLALLLAAPAAQAAGTLSGFHLELMDGVNTFPAGAHVSENPHSSPIGGCGAFGGSSDQFFESSAYHYFVAAGPFTDAVLPPGGCMDVREFWVSWDQNFLYLGVKGPNELYERGDLFIAIDTDNLTGPGQTQTSPWLKAVDFCGWRPDYFVAIESPKSAGGYAALLQGNGTTLLDSNGGLQWGDSGYQSCDNGGMYYEFRLPLALLGLQNASPRTVNFAVYTTYEDDSFDAYDSGPGCGQPTVWEQIGDYPYDGDHCGANRDCVSGTTDGSCGFADSDDNNSPGNALGGRFPSSDNSGFEVDTIGEYYSITNVFESLPVAVESSHWGAIKALYR